MRRRLRHLTALFALAFFFTPLALLASGVRATEFENRRLAERPELSAGWDVFDQATSYVVDHMPLRERAVRASAWKSINIFRTTPSYAKRQTNAMQPLPAEGAKNGKPAETPDTAAQVLPGVDDWYFLQGDTDRACAPFMDPIEAVARWERLGRVIKASGRTVVIVVAPDKSTIYPEHLPSPFTNEACAQDGRDELWGALAASREPTLVPLRDPVLAEKAQSDDPLFFRTDSHWNAAGSAVLVREVLARIGTRPLHDDEVVDAGTIDHAGDLGGLIGMPLEETAPDVRIDTGGTKLLPGKVAFLHDSFGIGPAGMLEAQSGSFTRTVWADDPPERWLEVMRAADTVVVETVEREVTYRASALLTEEFFAALQRELGAAR